MLFKNLPLPGLRAQRVVARLAQLSFGVYLAHIFVLNWAHGLLVGVVPPGLAFIPVQAGLTFLVTYALILVLSRLPRSRYLVG